MIPSLGFSAILICLSFPNQWNIYGFWPLAWIALVPLFAALHGRSLKIRFFLGLLHGVLTYSLLLQWLWPVHAAGTVLFVLALAIQSVVFVLLYKSPTDFQRCLYTAALWAAAEWVRTLILQGFYWGIAYSQSFEPALIQTAAWTGPYGVSFVIVLVNCLVWKAFQNPPGRRVAIVWALAVFAALYTAGVISLKSAAKVASSTAVCAVQPNISLQEKQSIENFDANIEAQVLLTNKTLTDAKADVIVWPETAFPADIFKDSVWYPRLQKTAVQNNAGFVFGAVPFINGKSFNSAVVLNSHGVPTGVYDKQFLVPISEYRPRGGFFGLFKGHGFDFTPGGRSNIFSVDARSRFGIMICSETCYPGFARRLVHQGAEFIVVMLNDGWFTRPAAIMMHTQNAVMRAVESGVEIVSVANTGWTGRIDARGVMKSDEQLPLQTAASGIFHVEGKSRPTLYIRIGDFFAEACSLFVIIFSIFELRRSRQQS
jgi:apolipoprotein N-acyltransferase